MPPLNLPPTYKDYERGRVLVAFNSTWESQSTVPSVAEPEPSLLVEPAWSEAVWKSKFHGAFVLNQRVDLHAIFMIPARWRGGSQSHLEGRGDLDAVRTASSAKKKPPTT